MPPTRRKSAVYSAAAAMGEKYDSVKAGLEMNRLEIRQEAVFSDISRVLFLIHTGKIKDTMETDEGPPFAPAGDRRAADRRGADPAGDRRGTERACRTAPALLTKCGREVGETTCTVLPAARNWRRNDRLKERMSRHFSLYDYFCFFLIYSFLGWCLEVCFCTVDTGKLVNGGFLNGPVCSHLRVWHVGGAGGADPGAKAARWRCFWGNGAGQRFGTQPAAGR